MRMNLGGLHFYLTTPETIDAQIDTIRTKRARLATTPGATMDVYQVLADMNVIAIPHSIQLTVDDPLVKLLGLQPYKLGLLLTRPKLTLV